MKGLPSSCSPAAQDQELYYWVLIAGPPLPPLSLTTHSKLSPWSELDLYPCSLEDLHQLSFGLSHHLLTTGLYPASFSPLHVGETTPMGSPMESPTTQLSTRKGDMHDSISQHWGGRGDSQCPKCLPKQSSTAQSAPHLEAGWKFQPGSPARKCVKSSQRFRGSRKPWRGGADSTGPQERWRDPDVTRSPQSLALPSALLPPLPPKKIKAAWSQ